MFRLSKHSNDDVNGRVRIGEIRVFYRANEVGIEVGGVEADHLDVAMTAIRDATRAASSLMMETVRADRARRPQRGDRVEVEGRQGVLVPCRGCGGHGLLHRPDGLPVERADEPPAAAAVEPAAPLVQSDAEPVAEPQPDVPELAAHLAKTTAK